MQQANGSHWNCLNPWCHDTAEMLGCHSLLCLFRVSVHHRTDALIAIEFLPMASHETAKSWHWPLPF